MARESIVDFLKSAQTKPTMVSTDGGGVDRVEAEKAFADLAKPVIDALTASTQLAEGELFKRVNTSNFGQFRTAIEEMKQRGLVRVVAVNQPYGDPVYGLTFGSGQS